MTTYVWENIAWQFHQGKPTILIFARDIETKKTKKIAIKGFKPYYYVSDPNGTRLNCFGNPIRKVVCNTPMEVTEQKNKYKAQGIETFEADIPFEMRYLIDKGIKYGFNEKMEPVDIDLILPRVVYYDIETNIPKGEGIDDEKNKHPIVAISVKDSYTGETKVFTARSGEKVHEWEVPCDNESGVLLGFFNYIKTTDPDIITGWYNLDFDMPYIIGRSTVTNTPVNGLCRLDNVGVKDVDRIAGRTHIDMLEFFKDWSKPMGQFPTYDLKYISKHFAGFEYEDFGEHISDLIERSDWKTLVQYSGNDVEALSRIDNKAGLISYHENLRRIVGIKYESTIKRTHIIESLLLRLGIKPIPNRKKHDKADFEGAVVIQPTVGIKKEVIFLDAKSLYPSIIIAFNLSPDIDGMIPKAIMYILNEREKYRKLKMDGKATASDEITEQSLKYIANSFYGAMGSPIFKLYDPNIASFITAKGREINASIRELVLQQGYTIVYGDTDSVAISPVNNIEEGKRLESAVNEHLKKWAAGFNIGEDMAPTVKFEKHFKSMFFKKKSNSEEAAKKKYVGHLVWKDGKTKDQIDYTGIEIKRSDTAPYTKTIMESFFKKVLIEDNPESAVDEVKDAFFKVKRGQIPLHQIAIPKAVKKIDNNGAWVKGMKHGVEVFNIRFDRSKKPKLLYCVSPYDEICIDDNIDEETVKTKLKVNFEKMADRVISQKMRSLVESIGYNWRTVVGGQTTLESLWSEENDV